MTENKAGGEKLPLYLAECTLLEVKSHLARSAKVVIPVGSTEQHGPHSPYGTDAILASEVAARLGRRIVALVAPAFSYGLSGDHKGYPGIPFLRAETMMHFVQDVVMSLAEGGFREIILVNGHYTNSIVLSAALMEIGEKLPKGTIAFPFNYWDALPPDQLGGYLSSEVGLHANIGETSAVLAIDPSLVKLEHAVREYPAFPVDPSPAMVSAYFFSTLGTLPRASQSGVWGDPSQSTEERGREYLDQIEEASVRFVENVEAMFKAFPEEGR